MHTPLADSSAAPLADGITLLGVRENNLKNVSCVIPRQKLVVITGVSGSGKSTLAFDTIFAEGQRRYLDCLSGFAKQLVGQIKRPRAAAIRGLSPTVAIDQKTVSRQSRSTVGTVTETLDALRVLFARVGTPHCPTCGEVIQSQTPSQVFEVIQQWPAKTRIQLLAPVVRGRKGDYGALLEQLKRQGIVRADINGETILLDELPENFKLERQKRHHIAAVLDRLILDPDNTAVTQRLQVALEKAFKMADGYVEIIRQRPNEDSGQRLTYSLHVACPTCDLSVPEIAPRLFSFNSPYGACEACQGLGLVRRFTEEGLSEHPTKPLIEGAIPALTWLMGDYWERFLKLLAETHGLPIDVPLKQLGKKERQFLFYGTGLKPTGSEPSGKQRDWFNLVKDFGGLIPGLEKRLAVATDWERERLEALMTDEVCATCDGRRLNPFALAVTLHWESIYSLGEKSIEDLGPWLGGLNDTLTPNQQRIAEQPLRELQHRVQFLNNVGLGYLTLNRRANTLSGGESQRLRLASQLGASLSGVTYVLDEPSIGLHPHNTYQLIETLKALRDQGNSLIVVEHDEEMIRAADWLLDIGPRAGIHGGAIVAQGPPDAPDLSGESLTYAYLHGKKHLNFPAIQEPPTQWLTLKGVTHHNLRNVTAKVPLGRLVVVTGMSGSGKSTLVFDVLQPAMADVLEGGPLPKTLDAMAGYEQLAGMIHIDQSPIGRTSRSNPATYMGIWDHVRKLFAATEESKKRGWQAGRFSFNVKGGRCEACKGSGEIQLEMTFLPNARTLCTACMGRRFTPETLNVTYQGKSIAEVLALTVEEALSFFGPHHRTLRQQLGTLDTVGLGYLTLGQPSNTLSGGECQRLKIASELCRRPQGQWLYLLDEPTVGLHWEDLQHLMTALRELVAQGHTVVVIEHHLDVIRLADYLIDLGPGAGANGGQIVAVGAPAAVAANPESLTGKYLAPYYKEGL